MTKDMLRDLVEEVLKRTQRCIRVEASGRHIHLSEADAMTLFGRVDLTKIRELSQPGQFLYEEKVTLVGPKGMIRDVAILGPCRGKTQVELSITDMRTLGIQPLVRLSGDLEGAQDIMVFANDIRLSVRGAAIVAKRHVHMQPSDAQRLGVKDGQVVAVRVYGSRQVIFEDVLVRVHPDFRLSMHLDYDEANAVGLNKASYGEIVWI